MSSVAALFARDPHRVHVPSKALAIPTAKVGVEMEIENFRLSKEWADRALPNWTMHPGENSLRNKGMEFVTSGGLVGQLLVDEIVHFCQIAKEKKWSEGFPRAGLHVHIDITDVNETRPDDLLYLVQTYMLFEHALFSFAGEWRRSCGFCDSLLASQADWTHMGYMLLDWENFNAGKLNANHFSKYQALNFLPMAQFGTLEFRHLPQTFDSGRILNWINFLLCIKKYAMLSLTGPLDVLAAGGPTRLAETVFGEWYDTLKPHIDNEKTREAEMEAVSLEILTMESPIDPWGQADNPLLDLKMEIKKEKVPFVE